MRLFRPLIPRFAKIEFGEIVRNSQLPSELRTTFETNGFLYDDARYGQGISLPDFYQNTYHAHPYIRREWSKYFESSTSSSTEFRSTRTRS